MKRVTAALAITWLTSTASGAEVFNQHIVSNIKMDAAAKKAVSACLLEKDIPICNAASNLKNIVNGAATYVERGAVGVVEDAVEYMGVEKPVAVVGYLAKVAIDKKIRIGRLKLPILNNDSGSFELSQDDVKWVVGWSF
jgi:hypothetical protein